MDLYLTQVFIYLGYLNTDFSFSFVVLSLPYIDLVTLYLKILRQEYQNINKVI